VCGAIDIEKRLDVKLNADPVRLSPATGCCRSSGIS
jgi:hypothetical protein